MLAAAIASTGCGPGDGSADHDASRTAAPTAVAAPMPAGDEAAQGRRQRLVGVRTTTVERMPLGSDVRTSGVVTLPQSAHVDVSARVDGWVRGLRADRTGMSVRKDDPLFVLYSPTLFAVENEFVAALLGRERSTEGAVPELRAHTEQLIEMVRGRLLLLGMGVNDVRELERRGRALGELTFVSPAAGIVLEKDVAEGSYVTAGQRLFRLADASRVWIEAGVRERDIALVSVGQQAEVVVDAWPGETLRGRVVGFDPTVRGETRTLTARIEVANPRDRLKPGMLATATLRVQTRPTLSVPVDAVLDTGRQQTVFVAQGGGYFDPRPVKVGRRAGDRIEVIEGLREGQTVATGATFFLESEGRLRSGVDAYRAPAASGGDSSAPGVGAAAAGAGADDASSRARLTVTLTPDPPRSGTVQVDARLAGDTSGMEVRAVLSMPPMPSMGMGAMRTEAVLAPREGGRFNGRLDVPHGGRWDLTVTATRGGSVLAATQRAVMVP